MKTFIAVDPASYSMGLCLVKDNELADSFTIKVRSPSMAVRCKEIAEIIRKLELPKLDCIFIEVLNSRCHRKVLWSIGAILAGLGEFSSDDTDVMDNEARSKGLSILVPSVWKKRFGVEKFNSSKRDKNQKILEAFKRNFPDREAESADEAVAVFLAQLIIESKQENKDDS